jgi:hypothetical protein
MINLQETTDRNVIDTNFDLEQKILQCWHVCDDIDDVIKLLNKQHLSKEEIVKLLESIKTIYQMRFEHTFDLYETVCSGLHQARQQRDTLAQRVRDFELSASDVAKKQQSKTDKSKQQKKVDK